ncbi:MAG: hypothetical protein HOP37_11900 [Cyclobacteriaceae bacterium]|nr:hypothetical protein [Cyclobacteriaceae bacterium]
MLSHVVHDTNQRNESEWILNFYSVRKIIEKLFSADGIGSCHSFGVAVRVRGLYYNQLGGWVWLLPLLWFAGGMWGNDKCQKRGRESLPVAVRWGIRYWVVIRKSSPLSQVILFSPVHRVYETFTSRVEKT